MTHKATGEQQEPLRVYLTVDVEIWCDGWNDIDRKFPAAFARYIHGRTPRGDYGLPYQLRVLQEHGLTGSFFVEPLFTARFGMEPLMEIVSLLREAGQETQLHLHTEWVDEARVPMLDGVRRKQQFLRNFDVDDQTRLIAEGRRRLTAAGAPAPVAFRAGSFGFNRHTITALQHNGIAMDSSYNLTMFGPTSEVEPHRALTDTAVVDDVCLLPMTVFRDGTGSLRHAQLTACSWPEMEAALEQAALAGQRAFVILSHGSELLDACGSRGDEIVIRRFNRLCAFLARHRDRFRLSTFAEGWPRVEDSQPQPLTIPVWPKMVRVAEQLLRRRPSWMRA